MGWVNVPIKNYWDWICYITIVTIPWLVFFFLYGDGGNQRAVKILKDNQVSSSGYSLLLLYWEPFTESFANNVFSIKIPQIAPIIMMLPELSISYAMQSMAFLDSRRKQIDSLLCWGEQIRMRIIYYLAKFSFFCRKYNKYHCYVFYFW